MPRLIILLWIALHALAARAQNCPAPQNLTVDSNPAVNRSLRMDKRCDVKKLFHCRGGTLVSTWSDNFDNTKVVGVECLNNDHPRAVRQRQMDASGLTAPLADIKRKAAEARMPAYLLEKALENYKKLKAEGKTDKECFAVQDLTARGAPMNWVVCMRPGLHVRLSDGSFENIDQCREHAFQNTDCRRFFGDRQGYCLPAGGSYVTAGGGKDPKGPTSVGLAGQDAGENAGLKVRFKVQHEDEREGMAVYVYPSRAEIETFVKNGKAPYWNESCQSVVRKAGWYGNGGSLGPSVSEVTRGQKGPSVQRPGSPRGRD